MPETLLPGNTYSAAGSSSPGITKSQVCFHTAAEGDAAMDLEVLVLAVPTGRVSALYGYT